MPIPDHIDLDHLDCEAEPSDRTALESVIDHLKHEMERLEAMEQAIMEEVRGGGDRGEEERGCSGTELWGLSPSVKDLSVVVMLAPLPGATIMARSRCMRGLSWGIGQLA